MKWPMDAGFSMVRTCTASRGDVITASGRGASDAARQFTCMWCWRSLPSVALHTSLPARGTAACSCAVIRLHAPRHCCGRQALYSIKVSQCIAVCCVAGMVLSPFLGVGDVLILFAGVGYLRSVRMSRKRSQGAHLSSLSHGSPSFRTSPMPPKTPE